MTETQKPAGGTNPAVKALVVLLVVIAAVLVYMLKEGGEGGGSPVPGAGEATALPRLVDLGRGKCIPCKMMEPVLEALHEELAGQLRVDYIDLTKNPKASEQYGIKTIPTQIFYNAAGKELYRHMGFYSKADILAKWNELGYPFSVLDEELGEDLNIIDDDAWGK